MWCYAIWCDDMMQGMMLMPKIQPVCFFRNDQNLFAVYFSALPLIFRCKFCIPLGTSFELFRLLFRRYSRWLFALRLIFWRYLALHSLRNDFWVENLRCAPLGTTFWSFSKLTLRSLRTTFCSFGETYTAIFSFGFLKEYLFVASAFSWVCDEGIFHFDINEASTGI